MSKLEQLRAFARKRRSESEAETLERRAKGRAAVDAAVTAVARSDRAAARHALEDSILGSMVDTITAVGVLADGLSCGEWRRSKMDVGGIELDVALPIRPVVEADGHAVLHELLRGVGRVVDQLERDGRCADRAATAHDVVQRLLAAQGWRRVDRSAVKGWASPAWLYPEAMFSDQMVASFVTEPMAVRQISAAPTVRAEDFLHELLDD